MNPQIQTSHLPKPLEAIKLYGYFNSSYGYIAQHLKVSKSTVFYWVQSFILSLQMAFKLKSEVLLKRNTITYLSSPFTASALSSRILSNAL